MTDFSFFTAALLAGFFGSTHCVGMCGGIAGVLSGGAIERHGAHYHLVQLSYQLGRITSYMLLGLGLGAVVALVQALQPALWLGLLLRVLASSMLVLMGLYLGRWWQGLSWLERLAGGALLRFWQPLQQRFLQLGARSQPRIGGALLAGALWGLLPCGLVYSAISTAALQPSWSARALFMLAFGLGTVPAMLFTTLLIKKMQASAMLKLRQGGAVLLIALGLWNIYHQGPQLMAVYSTPEIAPSSSNQNQHHHHSGGN